MATRLVIMASGPAATAGGARPGQHHHEQGGAVRAADTTSGTPASGPARPPRATPGQLGDRAWRHHHEPDAHAAGPAGTSTSEINAAAVGRKEEGTAPSAGLQPAPRATRRFGMGRPTNGQAALFVLSQEVVELYFSPKGKGNRSP